MPSKNRTEWMIAHSVLVEQTARPGVFTDSEGERNAVAAIKIGRTSGVGAVIIEGRPDDLVAFAQRVTDAAALIQVDTAMTPELGRLYG